MVAMDPILANKRDSVWSFALPFMVSAFLMVGVARSAYSGTWTVYDLSPDGEIAAIVDDREGGVWVKIRFSEEAPWQLWRRSSEGCLTQLPPPESYLYSGGSRNPASSARRGALLAVVSRDLDQSIWELVDGVWSEILTEEQAPPSLGGDSASSLSAAFATTDRRYGAVAGYFSGGSLPYSYNKLIYRINGEWTLPEIGGGLYSGAVCQPYNDGAAFERRDDIWGYDLVRHNWMIGLARRTAMARAFPFLALTWKGTSLVYHWEEESYFLYENSLVNGDLHLLV